MIISLENSEFLVQKILVVMSYLVSIPILGAFRSWVASRMGDDTGEQLGFSTLNPVTHISMLWLFMLLIVPGIPFGFGQYIPINPGAISGPWRRLKLLCAYFADAFFGVFLSLIVLLSMVVVFGKSPIELFMNFGIFKLASHYAPIQGVSSFLIVTGLFLIRFVIFNSMLAAFTMIINFFYMTFLAYFLAKNNFPDYADWIMLFAPLILLILFQQIVSTAIINIVLLISTILSFGLGLI